MQLFRKCTKSWRFLVESGVCSGLGFGTYWHSSGRIEAVANPASNTLADGTASVAAMYWSDDYAKGIPPAGERIIFRPARFRRGTKKRLR